MIGKCLTQILISAVAYTISALLVKEIEKLINGQQNGVVMDNHEYQIN